MNMIDRGCYGDRTYSYTDCQVLIPTVTMCLMWDYYIKRHKIDFFIVHIQIIKTHTLMDRVSLLDTWRFLIIKGLEFCCAQFTSFILNGTGSMLAPVNLQPADIVCYLSNGPSLNK